MDINYCIDYLGLNANSYKLDQSIPPHKITYWDDANPDKQPTGAELQTAWSKAKVKMDATVEIERLESQVTQRRLREAHKDSGWLDAQEALIAIEREKIIKE